MKKLNPADIIQFIDGVVFVENSLDMVMLYFHKHSLITYNLPCYTWCLELKCSLTDGRIAHDFRGKVKGEFKVSQA